MKAYIEIKIKRNQKIYKNNNNIDNSIGHKNYNNNYKIVIKIGVFVSYKAL